MIPFTILWFEDNIKDFKSIIPALEKHALTLNRHLEFEFHDNYPADFNVKVFNGNYSVAFIDLNLKNGQKGVEIINVLREYGTFLDVLLYSNNPAELESLTEGQNYVEGVFRHATLEGIEQKMKDIIDQINYKEIMVLKRYGH